MSTSNAMASSLPCQDEHGVVLPRLFVQVWRIEIFPHGPPDTRPPFAPGTVKREVPPDGPVDGLVQPSQGVR